MNQKIRKMIGALNYLVIYLAYEYGLKLERDSNKKSFLSVNKIKPSFKGRLELFNKNNNDFNFSKINIFVFIIATALAKNKKLFLDFFTDFESDFYFRPCEYSGIENPGLESLLKNKNEDLFFKTLSYSSEIIFLPSSDEELKDKVIQNFFEDKEEGKEILKALEDSIRFIADNRIRHFQSQTQECLVGWIKNNISLKNLKNDIVHNKEELLFFYESICIENLTYGSL